MLAKIWTDHLKDPKEKQEFALTLKTSLALKRLDEMLDNFLRRLESTEYNDDYSSPSWPYLQADRLGQKKALLQIKKLLTERK